MTMPLRLIVLDPQELVRQGLLALLAAEPELQVVGEAGTMADALAMVTKLRPHLVLMDLHLAETSGMDACRQMLEAMPALRLLVLTGLTDETAVAAAIRSGAHGYLLKDTPFPELVRAIRTVAGGRGYLDPRITQHAFQWLRTSTLPIPQPHGLHRLSPQERLILPLLAHGKTNKEIATALHLSDKTIKNYLANIYDKLGITRRTEAVAWFMREGHRDYGVPIS